MKLRYNFLFFFRLLMFVNLDGTKNETPISARRTSLPRDQHSSRRAVRRTRSVKNLNIFYFIFHHKPLSEIQCACASTRSEEIINKQATANMHVCAGTYSFLSPKYLVYSDKKGVLFRTKFYSFFFFASI